MSIDQELEDRFNQLFDEWKAETGYFSMLPLVCGHPNFQQLVAMGEPVAPLIYKKIVEGSGIFGTGEMLWQIFEEGPNFGQVANNMDKVEVLWLRWLEAKGYGDK